MIVEIITTGTELLLGEITNTNSVFLSKKLNENGYDVLYQTTIGDNQERLSTAIKIAINRADIIITSGGLGPTQGDLTKKICADIFEKNLIFNEYIASTIKKRFDCIHKKMTSNNLNQAYVPKDAILFPNTVGTAWGLCIEKNNKIIINLPGPPRELQPMFENYVLPYLTKKYNTKSVILSRILNTYGIGESTLEEILLDDIKNQHNPTLALLVRPYGIIIRMTAKATDKANAIKLLNIEESILRKKIDKYIYGINNMPLENIIINELLSKNLTISCAESCTGGLLSSRLSDIVNSSKTFKGSIVAYTNEVKNLDLFIDEKILIDKGAVSSEVTELLSSNIRHKYKTDIGIGITGFAEPNVYNLSSGLVFISISGKFGNIVSKNIFTGNRKEIKYFATQKALDMIRQYIKNYN